MKKKIRQLQVIMSLVIVFTLLLGCGALTYQTAMWAKSEMYELVEGKPQYFCSSVEDYYNWGERWSQDSSAPLDSKNAIGIVPAFYLAHEDSEHPIESSYVGFHSMLRNSKGEVIAEYQPYILFQKNAGDLAKQDFRVLVLGDEFAEEYSDFYSLTGHPKNNLSMYKNDALHSFSSGFYVTYYNEHINATERAIKVDGTCDDTFVYLNKLNWYCRTGGCNETYGFIPQKTQTDKGNVAFEEWFDYESGKSDLSWRSVSALEYCNTDYNKEAKEACEQGFDLFSANPDDCWEVFDDGLITSTLGITRDIRYNDGSDYYVFSCAYVFHPLKMAVKELSPVYAVAAGIAVVLIIFVCALLNFKLKETKSDSDDEQKGESAETEKASEETTENDENNTENVLEQHKDYT